MIDREQFEFRYFFNAGLDKTTGICDGEGSDVYELDDDGGKHFIGCIYGIMPSDISEMTDDELEELFDENAIIPNIY